MPLVKSTAWTNQLVAPRFAFIFFFFFLFGVHHEITFLANVLWNTVSKRTSWADWLMIIFPPHLQVLPLWNWNYLDWKKIVGSIYYFSAGHYFSRVLILLITNSKTHRKFFFLFTTNNLILNLTHYTTVAILNFNLINLYHLLPPQHV